MISPEPFATSVQAVEGERGPPRLLVFDSGLGGLTVHAAIVRVRTDADILYVADDAVFPYGTLSEEALAARVMAVMERLIACRRPDLVAIACNTASTAVLPPLRDRWRDIAFVGTVPAIKPAAAASRTGRIAVLATPGTVARDYTRDLVRAFAGDCAVDLVGAPRLATLAEAVMRGEPLDEPAVAAEIAPAFVDRDGRRTDTVVLACTHYPLLVDAFERLAPWPVTYVDPAPAIARRVDAVLAERGWGRPGDPGPAPRGSILFTSGLAPGPALAHHLTAQGLDVADVNGSDSSRTMDAASPAWAAEQPERDDAGSIRCRRDLITGPGRLASGSSHEPIEGCQIGAAGASAR